MSTSATRKHFNLLPTLAAALSLVSLSAVAQTPRSAPLGIYVGAAGGVSIMARGCDRFDSDDFGDCQRASAGGKLFGGYYLTPGLAAEVGYFYFGGLDRMKGPSSSSPSVGSVYDASVRESARALSVGINWQVELFDPLTNHIRLGWAWVHHDSRGYVKTVTATSPLTTTTESKDRHQLRIAPYLGVGLSAKLNDQIRAFTGADILIDGHKSLYLFSAGVSTEF